MQEEEAIRIAREFLIQQDMWPCILERVRVEDVPFYYGWGNGEHWWLSYKPSESLVNRMADIVFPDDTTIVLVNNETGEAAFFDIL